MLKPLKSHMQTLPFIWIAEMMIWMIKQLRSRSIFSFRHHRHTYQLFKWASLSLKLNYMATYTSFILPFFQIMYFQLHRPAYKEKSPSHMLAISLFLWMIHSSDFYTFENILDLGSSCHRVNTSISTFSAEWRKHRSQVRWVRSKQLTCI